MAKSKSQTPSPTSIIDDSIDYFTDKQRTEFFKYLLSLGTEKEIKNEDFLKLEEIYSNFEFDKKYHHCYADIYSTISKMQDEPEKYSWVSLGQNLEQINKQYKKQKIDISNELKKLTDHTNLEIARFENSLNIQNQTTSMIKNLTTELTSSQTQYDSLNKKSNEINKKLEHSKIDYITILGIFATIVVTFVGSFAFSTSVLQNLKDVSIYRLSFTICLIGIIFSNMIWLLTYFIASLTDKAIIWKNNVPGIVVNSIFLFILICTGGHYLVTKCLKETDGLPCVIKISIEPKQKAKPLPKSIPVKESSHDDSEKLELPESHNSEDAFVSKSNKDLTPVLGEKSKTEQDDFTNQDSKDEANSVTP